MACSRAARTWRRRRPGSCGGWAWTRAGRRRSPGTVRGGRGRPPGGVASAPPEALARTAAQLRDDADALDALAAELLDQAGTDTGLDVKVLAPQPKALRRRVIRSWLLRSGAAELTDAQLRAVDALIGEWRGQGG